MTLLKVSSGTLSSTSINFHARDHDTTPRMRRLPSIPILSTKTIQPRVCGDYLVSPYFQPRRYNPAYAGTTFLNSGSHGFTPIQPRVCGDYCRRFSSSTLASDTTPRMWGLRYPAVCTTRRTRYNPAYAGTTADPHRKTSSGSIQPRVCGDYPLIDALVIPCGDTTPRMRGLRSAVQCWRVKPRYNPAYAGTTCKKQQPTSPPPIQPRVCGDYLSCDIITASIADTTPRMRGLRWRHARPGSGVRYNPAYAGTTSHTAPSRRAQSIQPRVCGDYNRIDIHDRRHSDTTLRMRGLLREICNLLAECRYNPAYAGTTVDP